MCENAGIGGTTMPELIAALGDGGDLKEVRRVSDNCPACILAAIIQSGKQNKDDPDSWIEFRFKEEREAFWKDVNADRWNGQRHY